MIQSAEIKFKWFCIGLFYAYIIKKKLTFQRNLFLFKYHSISSLSEYKNEQPEQTN